MGDARAGADWPRVCVVGPLPPPSGGMANQCEQLVRLLAADGASVDLVRSNAPYRPAWVGRIPMVRALFRLLPFVAQVWRSAGRVDLIHVLANSGWAWHLVAAPALLVARLRGTPAIVNYRGGNADAFFARAPRHVLASLRRAALRVTPSSFLAEAQRRGERLERGPLGAGPGEGQGGAGELGTDAREGANRRAQVVDGLQIARDQEVRRVAEIPPRRRREADQVDDVRHDLGVQAMAGEDPLQEARPCHAQRRTAQ